MRTVIAALCPLQQNYGAGQSAINLAAALRARGHDASAWTPGDAPAGLRWWQSMAWKRRALVAYVESTGPYDVVDAPPVAISARLARHSRIVARSVQPDLRYLACEARAGLGRLWQEPVRTVAGLAYACVLALQVVAGWHRASVILCLGSLELAWMKRWFPWLRRRLASYVNALNDEDRDALRAIRLARTPRSEGGTRFLWLGRWTPHKGTERLVAFMKQRLASHPDDSFTIAGCGPEALLDLPADVAGSPRVRVIPSYTRSELLDLLRDHDAGLFTSIVEGWGLTLHEMLESGLRVFASAAGGVPELVKAFPGMISPFPAGSTVAGGTYLARSVAVGVHDLSWQAVAGVWEGAVEACRRAVASVGTSHGG